MSKSGVYEVFNRTATVKTAFRESARKAVAKACFDTEAIAKQEIGRQVYAMPELSYGTRTGAARASIYAKVPGKNNYAAAVADVKSRNPKLVVFPDYQISSDPNTPEGIVACCVLYGFFIEFGTTRVHVSVPARAFMTPAAEQVGPVFEQICLEALGGELR